jgi:hypothetical protein
MGKTQKTDRAKENAHEGETNRAKNAGQVTVDRPEN